MRCISPVSVFRSLALASLLVVASCGGSDDDVPADDVSADDVSADGVNTDGNTTTTDAPTLPDAEAADSSATSETTATDIDVDIDEEPPTTDDPPEEANEDVAALCSAYLDSISFSTVELGLEALIEIMGPDAPPGVQDALATLADPEGDIEGFFAAQNTVDGYVLPICRVPFTASIVPAADDASAADGFVGALRDGDIAAGERLAPSNVIASFDWNGFPDATWEFEADNSTVSMLLEPTVTVFCQVSGGAVEYCAFGE